MNFASLDNIVSRLQQRLEAGVVTDEGRIDYDLLKDAVHTARAAVIEERFSTKTFVPKTYMQRLCCIKIECKAIICDGIDSGQTEYVAIIPQYMGSLGVRAFGFVGTPDGRQAADYRMTITEAAGRPFPFGGFSPFIYTVRGMNELVMKNLPVAGMDMICVEAVWANPEDEQIKDCTGEAPYPVGAGDIQVIEDLAYKTYREMLGLPPDLSVDTVANK